MPTCNTTPVEMFFSCLHGKEYYRTAGFKEIALIYGDIKESYREATRLINHIPCYAARKELGLCNSSAVGEKANDLIVSERQKHNGMSWTKKGTVALAAITALAQNNEYRKWFEEKDVDFKLAA